MQPIFIGGAWPYANGPLHVGQIASLLPGDVLARYFRLAGHPVLFVSGSDCHGTPITLRALRENCSPGEIAERYHRSFVTGLTQLGFTYDCYSRTDLDQHKSVVQDVFRTLLAGGLLVPRTAAQVFCPVCQRHLADRYVEGTCPHCGAPARGDQCDTCTRLLEPLELGKRHCRLCGAAVQEQPVEQLVLRLSACQDFLADYFTRAGGGFRLNARQETSRYLQSGLHDRAATRSLDWGVDVPLAGYGDRRVYVWIDAVLGYLSASRRWAEARGQDWRPFWSADAQAWYVHGKDNIPFHSLILPALLHGFDPSLKLPDRILSSEYLTLEGRKISTSQNWAIWLDDLLARYPADAIRYYLISNNPEKRDGDFSQRAFILAYNGELLGAFGNLVQRTLQFICRFYEGCTPNEPCDPAIRADLAATFADCGRLLSQGEIKAALARAFGLVRRLNQFFDQERPWQTRHDDPTRCDRTLATCLHGLLNLSSLLDPFLPFSCARLRHCLGWTEAPVWRLQAYPGGRILAPPQLLYPRLDETSELAWALTGSRDAQSVR